MRWVGFEEATSESVSAHGRLDVLRLQHRSSQARGAKLAVDLVLELKTPFTRVGSRPVGGWYPYRYRPREPACLSQLTRCHRGKQHSRWPMRTAQTAQTAGGNGCCFLYVFCLIERVVESHTAGQDIVSFGKPTAEALKFGEVLEGWQVGWLGCLFGLDGGEGQSVPGCCGGRRIVGDWARAWESPLTL